LLFQIVVLPPLQLQMVASSLWPPFLCGKYDWYALIET
jgi:hypothetical protein